MFAMLIRKYRPTHLLRHFYMASLQGLQLTGRTQQVTTIRLFRSVATRPQPRPYR